MRTIDRLWRRQDWWPGWPSRRYKGWVGRVGRVGNLLFGFSCESLFLESERAIHSFKRVNHFCHSFCKECQEQLEQIPLLQRARRAMKSNSFFCFGHKNGKSMVRRTNLKQIPLKKSKSLFHRVGNSLIDFSCESLVFCEQKSDSLVKKSESLPSLYCNKRR